MSISKTLPKNCLVIYQSTNRKNRKDATGAFIPEAKAFQKIHGVPDGNMIPIPHDMKRHVRWSKFSFSLNFEKMIIDNKLDAIVYFGHGTPRSLPLIGAKMSPRDLHLIGNVRVAKRTSADMAKRIVNCIKSDGKVILYACLAGKGFGFADRLDEHFADLGRPYIRTISHITAGHTSWNPNAEYSGEGPDRMGVPIIKKSDPLWKKWISALRSNQWFRLSFPFMSVAEIRSRLTLAK